MSMDPIAELQDAYMENRLIPVVGSGVSVPFGLPDWATLLREAAQYFKLSDVLQKEMAELISKWDYISACSVLTERGNVQESKLQSFVAERISEAKQAIDKSKVRHNYEDLAQMGKARFITTNYDEYLNEFVPNAKSFDLVKMKGMPVNEFSRRRFHGTIIPIHGEISRPDSIVLSQDSYRRLYESDEFEPAFQLLRQQYTFLFIGFSFDDYYFKNLFRKVVGGFETRHYILFDSRKKSQSDKIRELFSEYGVKSVFYESSDSDRSQGIRDVLDKIIHFHDPDIVLEGFDKTKSESKEMLSDEAKEFKKKAEYYIEQEKITELKIFCEETWNRADFRELDIDLRLETVSYLMWCEGFLRNDDVAHEYMRYIEEDPILSQHSDKITIMFAELQWNRRDWASAKAFLQKYLNQHLDTAEGLAELLLDLVTIYEKFLPSVKQTPGKIPVYDAKPRTAKQEESIRLEYAGLRKKYISSKTYNLLHPENFSERGDLEIAYYWLGIAAGQLFHEHEDAIRFLYRAYEITPKMVYEEVLAHNYVAIAEKDIRYSQNAMSYDLNRNALLKARECFKRVLRVTDGEMSKSFMKNSGADYLHCLFLLRDFLGYTDLYEQIQEVLPDNYGILVDKAMCDAQVRYEVDESVLCRLTDEDKMRVKFICKYHRITFEAYTANNKDGIVKQMECLAEEIEKSGLWEQRRDMGLLMLDAFWIVKDPEKYRFYMEKLDVKVDGFYFETAGEIEKAKEWFEREYQEHKGYSVLHVLVSFYERNGLDTAYEQCVRNAIADEDYEMSDRVRICVDFIAHYASPMNPASNMKAMQLYVEFYDVLAQDEEELMRIEEQLKMFAADYGDVEIREKRLRFLIRYAPKEVCEDFYSIIFRNYMGNYRFQEAGDIIDEMRKKELHVPDSYENCLANQRRPQKRKMHLRAKPTLSSRYLEQMKVRIRTNGRFFLDCFGVPGEAVLLPVSVIMLMFCRGRRKELENFKAVYIVYGGVISVQTSLWREEDPFLRMVSQWIEKAPNVVLCAPTLRGLIQKSGGNHKIPMERLQINTFAEEHTNVYSFFSDMAGDDLWR